MAGGLARLALTGLSTMEVITLAVAYVATMAFLWMSGTVRPERLITQPGFRSAWIIVALGLLRPITWTPYVLPFVLIRSLASAAMHGRRPVLRNAVAHLATIGFLAAVLWLVALVVGGALTAALSGLAFMTGSGAPSTLGSFRGDWNSARVAGLIALVVVVRLVLPPLDPDLALSSEPVLWFGGGARGRFDRIAMISVVAASALLAALGALLAR